jgi:hypothetical protein
MGSTSKLYSKKIYQNKYIRLKITLPLFSKLKIIKMKSSNTTPKINNVVSILPKGNKYANLEGKRNKIIIKR